MRYTEGRVPALLLLIHHPHLHFEQSRLCVFGVFCAFYFLEEPYLLSLQNLINPFVQLLENSILL